MSDFGNGPIIDMAAEDQRQSELDQRAVRLSGARNKPLSEMTDEEVLYNFNPDGFGWSEAPNPDNDPKVEEHNKQAGKIRERSEQIRAQGTK